MSTESSRQAITHLARGKPELRADLPPLLKKSAQQVKPDDVFTDQYGDWIVDRDQMNVPKGMRNIWLKQRGYRHAKTVSETELLDPRFYTKTKG